jgi:hypothetical protein
VHHGRTKTLLKKLAMSSSGGSASKGWAPISTDDDPSIYERPPARSRLRRRIQDCGCGALLAVVLLTGVWAVSAPCCTPALQDILPRAAPQGCAPLARVRCIAVLRDGRAAGVHPRLAGGPDACRCRCRR